MCDPLTATAVGLQMAGSVAGFAGQKHQTDLYNASAKQNAINASLAAEHGYEDEGRKYIYDSRQIQQEGYQAAMHGKQAVGTSAASAGAAGFDLGSLTVGDVLSGENQKTEWSMDNIRTKQDDRKRSILSNDASLEAQAQGRINSMPQKEGPSALGLAIGLASDVAGGFGATDKGRAKFNSFFGGAT